MIKVHSEPASLPAQTHSRACKGNTSTEYDILDSFVLGAQERKKKLNSREVRKFYEEQNRQIAAYLKVGLMHLTIASTILSEASC